LPKVGCSDLFKAYDSDTVSTGEYKYFFTGVKPAPANLRFNGRCLFGWSRNKVQIQTQKKITLDMMVDNRKCDRLITEFFGYAGEGACGQIKIP